MMLWNVFFTFPSSWAHFFDRFPVLRRYGANKAVVGNRDLLGLDILVNKWCNPGHIAIKKRVCSPDIEPLALSLN